MGFAALYPSYEDGAGAGGSRQKRLSPSSSLPMPPRTEPSPRSLPPDCGAAASMRPAMRENGSDCSQTVPGPVSVARNMPSRSEEHTSELQSLMRLSYAVFCLKKKQQHTTTTREHLQNHT